MSERLRAGRERPASRSAAEPEHGQSASRRGPGARAAAFPWPGVVQRVVDTNGGRWDTTEYSARTDGAESHRYVGANIRLTFQPNSGVTGSDAETVGLVQTVKTMSRVGQAEPEPSTPENKAKLGLKLGKDEGDYGRGIDKRDQGDFNGGLAPVSPVYAEQSGYDSKTGKVAPKVAPEGGSLDYFGRNWLRSKKSEPAELADRPRSQTDDKTAWTAEFEVAATILDGTFKGSYLGSVRWGWSCAPGGEPVLAPGAIEKVSAGTPTAAFQQAGRKWNRIASSLPKEDVIIPATSSEEKETRLSQVAREVRLLPDQIETLEAPDYPVLSDGKLIEAYKVLAVPGILKNPSQQNLERHQIATVLADRILIAKNLETMKLVWANPDLKTAVMQIRTIRDQQAEAQRSEALKSDVADLLGDWRRSKSNPKYNPPVSNGLIRSYVVTFTRYDATFEKVRLAFLQQEPNEGTIADLLGRIALAFKGQLQDPAPEVSSKPSDKGGIDFDSI